MKKAAGSTNVFVPMHLRANSTVTDFDITYTREGDTPSAKVDMTAGTIAAHADNTAVYIDPTNAPELVQICPPDAAFAPGVDSVVISIHNPEEGWHIDKEIQLVVDIAQYQGMIWFDSNASNAGTALGIDGTPTNPVSTRAALKVLMDSSGFKSAMIIDGVLPLDVNFTEYTFQGRIREKCSVNISGALPYGITDCTFKNLTITGDGDNAGFSNDNEYIDCNIQANFELTGIYRACGLINTDAGILVELHDCYNSVAGTIRFTMTAGATTNFKAWNFRSHDIVQIAGSTGGTIDFINGEGYTINLEASNTGGAINLSGNMNLIDNSSFGAKDFSLLTHKHLIDYEGAVWLDANTSNTNTNLGTDGTPSNPVSDMPSAITLAASLGTKTIKVKGSVSVAVDVSGHNIEAWDSSGRLTGSASVNYASCTLKGLRIDGLFAGNYLTTNLFDCEVFSTTGNLQAELYRCVMRGTVLIGSNTVRFINCYGDFTIDYSGSSTSLVFFNHSGAVNITNFSPPEGTIDAYSNGSTKIELEASCTNGFATFRGIGVLVDDSAGTTVDVTEWENIPLAGAGADITHWNGNPVTGDGDWAELQTDVDDILTDTADVAAIKAQTDKMNFNANDYIISALANVETIAVDQITQNIGKYFNAIKTGTTQSGGHTTTSINSNANFDEADAVIGSLIVFQHNAGDNAFAARVITANGEANGVIEFSPALPQIPPDGAQFIVVPAGFNIDGATLTNQVTMLSRIATPSDLGSGPNLSANMVDIRSRLDFLRNGTAQAGAAGSITLDAGASAVDDFYNQLVVGIISGTGAGQAKRIAGYNGTTKVATVDSNWATTPDATSVFTLFPFAEVPVDINAIRDAILADSTPFNGADIAAIKAVTDILNSVDGVGLADREKFILAFIKGKITRSGNAFTYFEQNGTTPAFTLTGSTGERTPS